MYSKMYANNLNKNLRWDDWNINQINEKACQQLLEKRRRVVCRVGNTQRGAFFLSRNFLGEMFLLLTPLLGVYQLPEGESIHKGSVNPTANHVFNLFDQVIRCPFENQNGGGVGILLLESYNAPNNVCTWPLFIMHILGINKKVWFCLLYSN